VGPALGQHGVNIMGFCKEFNAATQAQAKEGLIVPVLITIYSDRSFTFIVKTPPAAILIKKALGLHTEKKKGSGAHNPGKEKVQTDCKGFMSIDACPTYQLGLDHERRTNILIVTTSVVGLTTAVIGLFFTSWGSDEPAKPEKKDAFLMPVFGLGNGVNIGAVGRF